MRLLTRAEIVAWYDRFGARQDTQGWYEDAPLAALTPPMEFATATAVLELGAGTGKLAHDILCHRVPAGTPYLGLDISPVMAHLAMSRLAACPNAFVAVGDVRAPLPLRDNSISHAIAAYVLDIFSETEIAGVYEDMHRVLRPGGVFGAVSLTRGETLVSRVTSRAWALLHAMRPQTVGGCRPLDLQALVPRGFESVYAGKTVAGGIASEGVIVRKRGTATPGGVR